MKLMDLYIQELKKERLTKIKSTQIWGDKEV